MTTVRILSIVSVTHDVKCFRVEKPSNYHFAAGQATDLSVNKKGMEDEKRPFTFTALAESNYLEFTIKRYADHHGVTDLLHQLVPGDELIIGDVWGAIEYKGPGYFIAGGAGITPFIAILRQLHQNGTLQGNTLIFSNKTAADIIYREELEKMLGANAIFVLTREEAPGCIHGYVNEAYLKSHIHEFDGHFYVCGPDPMIHDINSILTIAGTKADAVVFEK